MRFLQSRFANRLSRPRWAGGPGIFRRDTRGAAALEFAIVGLPFFAVVFAILEMAIDFMIYAEIDTAVQKSIADIRSGSVQLQNLNAEQFKSQVLCPRMPGLNCSSIMLNVALWPLTGATAWRATGVDTSIQNW
ncbi:MAG: TadE-like protein, partial [Hyphomicrobiales bacterium]|nr:TadE-like protein [Hyphomicrobiales bacterium]